MRIPTRFLNHCVPALRNILLKIWEMEEILHSIDEVVEGGAPMSLNIAIMVMIFQAVFGLAFERTGNTCFTGNNTR